MQDFQKRKD